MNKALAIYIAISFISIAVLGFIGVAFMNSNHMGCIASTSEGAMCPLGASVIDFINFHFNALKNFSLAVLVSWSMIVALSLLIYFVLDLNSVVGGILPITKPHLTGVSFYDFIPPVKLQLIRWLSFHENSPSFA
ncbi:MAG: hypothetical protein KGJ89_03120 [Patescibacteria group bacterium]|nr:hypothetical protein [Patescibacteria group bacterium]MDE2015458.1 hypothetical protein [Patescibacteria group bacterium]MDE2226926.1 hypothetical protein [Patescibacteria group bacterium]